MAIEWMIPDPTEPASSRTITIIMNRDNDVRTAKVTIEPGEDINQVVGARLDDLYETGVNVPDGLRGWFAIKQRLSNERMNQAIYAFFGVMMAGGNLAQMNDAAEAVLLNDSLQSVLYGLLHQAIANASEAELKRFLAVAFTVAYSKLGQR